MSARPRRSGVNYDPQKDESAALVLDTYEQEAQAPKRKVVAQPKASRKKKDAAIDRTADVQDPHAPQFEPIELPPRDARYHSLNNFRDRGGLQITDKPGVAQKYTPPPQEAEHIRDMPLIRNFVLVTDAKGNIPTTTTIRDGRVPENKANTVNRTVGGTTHTVFKISASRTTISDDGAAQTEVLDLYHWPATRRLDWRCATDTAVCPTQDDAKRLGKIAVDLLNRLPPACDEQLPLWNKAQASGGHIPTRGFVEVNALFDYAPDMDWTQRIHKDFKTDDMTAIRAEHWQSGSVRAYNVNAMVMSSAPLPVLPLTPDMTDVVVKNQVDLNLSTGVPPFNAQKVSAIQWPVAHNLFVRSGPIPSTSKATTETQRVCQYNVSRLLGLVGNERQIQEYWRRLMTEFTTGSREPSRKGIGPFNNRNLFAHVSTPVGRNVLIRLSNEALRTTLQLPPAIARLEDPNVASALNFTLASKDLVLINAVKNTVLQSICKNEGLRNAIVRGHIMCGDIDTGKVTRTDILSPNAYVPVMTNEASMQYMVMCMHCGSPKLVGLTWQDEQGRTLCSGCIEKVDGQPIPFVTSRMEPLLKKLLADILYSDQQRGVTYADKGSHFRILKDQIVDDDRWISSCSKGEKSLRAAINTNGVLRGSSGLALSHPDQPSIGKIFPLWVMNTSQNALHYYKNVFLQTLLEQCVQGTWPICMLPFRARATAFAIAHGGPMKEVLGYNHELLPPDVARFHKVFAAAADNAWRIQQSIPFTNKGRLNQTVWGHNSFHKKLMPMMKSGKWDGTIMRREQKRFVTRATMWHFQSAKRWDDQPRKEFDLWATLERGRILGNLEMIVKPAREGGKFNRYNIDMTTYRNDDGSYWMTRIEERPSDANLSFDFYEQRGRLWTLDEGCDNRNETTETPETMCYESLIQFLETGNKCHVTGETLSVLSGHPFVYSYGRAVFVVDADLKPLRPIQARDPMRTGCTVLAPTNIAEQYDWERRTIVKESWAANRARSNYFMSGEDPLSDLRTAISAIDVDEKYCNPDLESVDGYYSVSLDWRWQEEQRVASRAADKSEDLNGSGEENGFDGFDTAVDLDSFDDITKLGNDGGNENQEEKPEKIGYDATDLLLEQDPEMYDLIRQQGTSDMADSTAIAYQWIISTFDDDQHKVFAYPRDDGFFVLHVPAPSPIKIATWSPDGEVSALKSMWRDTLIQEVTTPEPAAPDFLSQLIEEIDNENICWGNKQDIDAKMAAILHWLETEPNDPGGGLLAQTLVQLAELLFTRGWRKYHDGSRKAFSPNDLWGWKKNADLSQFMWDFENVGSETKDAGLELKDVGPELDLVAFVEQQVQWPQHLAPGWEIGQQATQLAKFVELVATELARMKTKKDALAAYHAATAIVMLEKMLPRKVAQMLPQPHKPQAYTAHYVMENCDMLIKWVAKSVKEARLE